MQEMNEPSTSKSAFNCPHCGAFTSQHWLSIYCEYVDQKTRVPKIYVSEDIKVANANKTLDEASKQSLLKTISRRYQGEIYLENLGSYKNSRLEAANIFINECFNCHKLGIWAFQCLIYPIKKHGSGPNQDLPEEIKMDFEEARSIVNLSPRGACAILRLCIQKICIHLGEKGVRIDDDIASLVAKGLNPRIQKALDIVRVIGNEAVHPGVLDLKDDNDTAEELFSLVNIISEQLISVPKSIDELYSKLPEKKRQAIEKRDKK